MKIFALIAIIILTIHNAASADNERNFYTLNRHNGLSDNCIWQLLQLGDGRMVSVTPHSVDIFDGQGITTVEIDTSDRPDIIAKIIVLTDCMSPIVGYEEETVRAFNKLKKMGVKFMTTAELAA